MTNWLPKFETTTCKWVLHSAEAAQKYVVACSHQKKKRKKKHQRNDQKLQQCPSPQSCTSTTVCSNALHHRPERRFISNGQDQSAVGEVPVEPVASAETHWSRSVLLTDASALLSLTFNDKTYKARSATNTKPACSSKLSILMIVPCLNVRWRYNQRRPLTVLFSSAFSREQDVTPESNSHLCRWLRIFFFLFFSLLLKGASGKCVNICFHGTTLLHEHVR